MQITNISSQINVPLLIEYVTSNKAINVAVHQNIDQHFYQLYEELNIYVTTTPTWK